MPKDIQLLRGQSWNLDPVASMSKPKCMTSELYCVALSSNQLGVNEGIHRTGLANPRLISHTYLRSAFGSNANHTHPSTLRKSLCFAF